MGPTISAEKALLRRSIKEFHLSPKEQAESDACLLARFLALPQVEKAPLVFLYYGVGAEPDTGRLLAPLTQAGKLVALPRCLEQRGPFGIPEPDGSCPILSPTHETLLLVPALCCDRLGFRLGHGGGYYDRYLSHWQPHTAALCRDVLLRERLPVEPHDQRLELILTETRCLSLS